MRCCKARARVPSAPVRALAGTALAALAAASFACSPAPPDRPNIVLISIDTLRYDYLGTTGAPEGISPALDRLGRQGVVFSNAFSTTSWTLPSHISLLTGQYPASHGVINDDRTLLEEKETLAEFLSGLGYRTGGFWAGPYLHPAWGFAQGFDTYAECVNYRMELNEAGRVKNTGHANMRSRSGVTSGKTHARATAWLDSLRTDAPYFLFLHYWDPHTDYEAPAPYDRYLDPDSPSRITGRGIMLDKRVHLGMTPTDRKRFHDLYRGEIRWTDSWIERIVAVLEERGDLENTIIVVVADHGEEFFEHGRHGHRLNLYDESVRVPFLIRFPESLRFPGGGPIAALRGSVVNTPVSLVDVFPTLAALVTDGAAPSREWQGADLTEAIAGRATPRLLYASLHEELQVVRNGEWKLIRDPVTKDGELYRVGDDPGETVNLAPGPKERGGDAPPAWNVLQAALDGGSAGRYAPEGPGEAPEIDPDTEAELRALGYTE